VLTVDFVRKVRGPFPTVRLKKFVEFVWQELARRKIKGVDPRGVGLTVVFAKADVVRRLNKQYRGQDKPTDVLSFQPGPAGRHLGLLGELVLCPLFIKSQARDHHWPEFYEYAYMVLHGVLHLLGYDHEKDDNEARKMYRLQDEVFDIYLRKLKPRERRNRTSRDQVKVKKHLC